MPGKVKVKIISELNFEINMFGHFLRDVSISFLPLLSFVICGFFIRMSSPSVLAEQTLSFLFPYNCFYQCKQKYIKA